MVAFEDCHHGALLAADLRSARALARASDAKLRDAAPGHVAEASRLVVDVLTREELGALGTAARKIVETADPRLSQPR